MRKRPRKPQDARSTRDRAVPRTRKARAPRACPCVARRPANSRYACSSATRSLRNHAAQCVSLHRLHCRVDTCSNEERAVPRICINFVPARLRVDASSNATRRKGRLVFYLRVPSHCASHELALRINFAPAPRIICESTLHNALRCVASNATGR